MLTQRNKQDRNFWSNISHTHDNHHPTPLPCDASYRKLAVYFLYICNTKNQKCTSICHLNLNPFPNKPWFLCACSTSLLKKLWEKEKLLITSNFSFSHSVFYTFVELSAIFTFVELSAIFINFEIVVCLLFQFGRVQNLYFRKR